MHSLTPEYLTSLRYDGTQLATLRALGEYQGKQQLYAAQSIERLKKAPAATRAFYIRQTIYPNTINKSFSLMLRIYSRRLWFACWGSFVTANLPFFAFSCGYGRFAIRILAQWSPQKKPRQAYPGEVYIYSACTVIK